MPRNSKLLAAAAKESITPIGTVPLSGFLARLQGSSEIGDEIHSRALVLRLDKTWIVIVQLDLLAIADWHVREIRQFCLDRFGIQKECVLVSSTHTHSAPGLVGLRGCKVMPLEYHWYVMNTTKRVITDAVSRLTPATVQVGRVPYRLGINRREETSDGVVLGWALKKQRPIHLDTISIETSKQHCWLFHHPAHPYILGGDSTLLSGDFPSFAASELESSPNVVAMYLQGCAGNIAPEGAFEGLGRLRLEGKRMAAAVRSAVSSSFRVNTVHLRAHSKFVHLPYNPLPTLPQLEKLKREQERVVRPGERTNTAVNEKIAAAMADWSYSLERVIRNEAPLEPAFAEVQVLRIGDIGLVGLSGEPFYEIGRRIVRQSPVPYTFVLGYCNAYTGYLPTSREFPGGGYEVNDSYRYLNTWQISPKSEKKVTSAATTLLSSLD